MVEKKLITILTKWPEDLNTKINIYQAKRNINLKRNAVVQMVKDFTEGKKFQEN